VIFHPLYSQTHKISGYVEDMSSGERIIGAYVIDSTSKSVAQTNNFGFFILKNIGKRSVIYAKYIGLKSDMIHLSLQNDTLLNIKMEPSLILNEVIVESSGYKRSIDAPLGIKTIPVKNLASIPALGEPDLLKAIQSQPGIKGGVEGSAGIFVRGGGSGENLFMLDDVPIYNVSHLYGFISTFNSSAIKDIKLYKGCFPAKYGGRVSSVIDVRSRDGNNKSLKGEISLGIISSKFTFEGPLFNKKTTFIISGRRSYFDMYSGSLKKMNLLETDFPDYYFYDLNARLTHSFSNKDKLYISFYNGKDKIRNKNDIFITKNNSATFSDNNKETSGWGNFIGSLRWNHAFNNNIFSNTTVALSTYNYFIVEQYESFQKNTAQIYSLERSYSASYKSRVNDFIVKTDFDYSLSNKHKILFGLGTTFHAFMPGENTYGMKDQIQNIQIDTSFVNLTIYANEPFFYIEDELEILNKLKINSGLRISGLFSENSRTLNAEPRLSLNYSLLPWLSFKTGYSRMVQYMHLLSTSGVNMPTDIWIPATKGIKALLSDQINTGISIGLSRNILISLEVYKKWLDHTSDFRNGSSIVSDLAPWFEKVIQGNGITKGIELSIEKSQGSFIGSINYTLSTADRKYSNLNNGQAFPFNYDRLNDFNFSVNYQISEKWDVSLLWLYGTGYPVTVPVEKYSPALNLNSNQGYIPLYFYPSKNNVRLPAYHRLDIGLHYKTKSKLGEHNLSFDIFNVYNRKNPINLYHWDNYSFKYSYLLPIIPSITYTLKFK
jgi:hypothetical protein